MAKLGELSVGSIVKANVDGTPKNFIVVHQGLPSSDYDSSCNGTWLLMEDIYEERRFHEISNDYENSEIHTYLNDTFFNLFDEDIKSLIKQVKLPYTKGEGLNGVVSQGASGISAKVFFLSCSELQAIDTYSNVEGDVLSYFDGVDKTKKVAKFDGTKTAWWTRSTANHNTRSIHLITTGGVSAISTVYSTKGVRPALVLDQSLSVDDSGMIVASSLAIRGGVIIDGSRKELTEGYVNIGGVWKPVVESYVNIGGVWKPSHE